MVFLAAITIYGVAVAVGICLYLAFRDSLDDFLTELQWTLAQRHRTMSRTSALPVRFRVLRTCKRTIAASATGLRRERRLLSARLAQYGSRARAVGRVAVPERVTSTTRELKPAQRRALLALEAERGASLTRSDYERLTGVGRSQAASQLSELVSAGLLVRVGEGRSTRYALGRKSAAQRRWTPQRIRRELDGFCAGRSTWPTPGDFKSAGRGDLYVAASRYGGVAHWANELGLERPGRAHTPAAATQVPLRRRLAWALAGGLVGVAGAAATLTLLVAAHDRGSSGKTAATAPAAPQPRHGAAAESLHPLRLHAASTRIAGTHARAHAPQRAAKPPARPAPRVQSTHGPQTTFVSNPVHTASARSAPAAGQTLTAAAPHGGGPAPLPAPPEPSAPTPLRAP